MFRSLCCDCIATIQHFLTLSTHPLSLTLLPTSLILHIGTHLVGDAGSEITARACFLFWRCTYDHVSCRLFHLSPRLVSFDAAYLQDSSCQWFAYLPGLSLHVPRRLRKVRDSNPRIVLTIAALAVRCFQPLSQPSCFCMSLWYSDHRHASQIFNLPRCKQPLNLVACI